MLEGLLIVKVLLPRKIIREKRWKKKKEKKRERR